MVKIANIRIVSLRVQKIKFKLLDRKRERARAQAKRVKEDFVKTVKCTQG